MTLSTRYERRRRGLVRSELASGFVRVARRSARGTRLVGARPRTSGRTRPPDVSFARDGLDEIVRGEKVPAVGDRLDRDLERLAGGRAGRPSACRAAGMRCRTRVGSRSPIGGSRTRRWRRRAGERAPARRRTPVPCRARAGCRSSGSTSRRAKRSNALSMVRVAPQLQMISMSRSEAVAPIASIVSSCRALALTALVHPAHVGKVVDVAARADHDEARRHERAVAVAALVGVEARQACSGRRAVLHFGQECQRGNRTTGTSCTFAMRAGRRNHVRRVALEARLVQVRALYAATGRCRRP